MTPRIILPADTTVTVGDTLWWGVAPTNSVLKLVNGRLEASIPPEWQALTEACTTCGGSGDETMDSMLAVGIPGGQFPIGPCPDCIVEVRERCTALVYCVDGHPLGHAVIDGDWAPIVDWKDQHAIATLDRFIATGWEGDPSWFGLYTRGTHLGRKLERITLHGHTDPGGYAARFEVIA